MGHIYLTGFRATGKTSVARRLSTLLSLPMIDLDVRIRQRAGKSIAEVFSEFGESGFRDLEAAELALVAKEEPAVISLGGGAILRETNRSVIRATGHCVWLTAEVATIMDRLAGDRETNLQRPALTELAPEAEIRQLLEQRKAFYDQSANFQVRTDGQTIEQIANVIAIVVPRLRSRD